MDKKETLQEVSTPTQRLKIKEILQDELLKRGFTAKIVKLYEYKQIGGFKKYLRFYTEEFQTVPVIFKAIRVEEFNSGFTLDAKESEDGKIILTQSLFYISINVRYQHFKGGSNGAELFYLSGSLSEDGLDVFNIKTS